MTKVRGWDATGSIDSFRIGVSAFRNARDLAKEYREDFIREANARGPQARVAAAQAEATQAHEHNLSAPYGSLLPMNPSLL